MGMSFADMHPELASEFSERNLPLAVSDITYGSNKKSGSLFRKAKGITSL